MHRVRTMKQPSLHLRLRGLRRLGLGLLLGLSSTAAVQAQDARSTAEDALALMKKAQAFIKTQGMDKAVAEFNNPKSPFNSKSEINRHGDLYLFSLDAKGFQIIHGINPRIRGTNKFDMRDANGVYLIREMAQLCFASAEGRGWVQYQWPNPVNRQVETKLGYVERVPGTELCLGTGIYK